MFSQTATTFTRSGLLFMPNWLRLCSRPWQAARLLEGCPCRPLSCTSSFATLDRERTSTTKGLSDFVPALVLYILGIEPSCTSIKTGWHSNAPRCTRLQLQSREVSALCARHHLPGIVNDDFPNGGFKTFGHTHNLHSRREYRT